MKFPKLVFRKSIPVLNTDKRDLGRVPVGIAKELIKTNHAELLRNHPAIIGLKHIGRKTASRNQAVSASPLKNLIHTASLFTSKSNRMIILNSILFKIVDDTLCVMATDLESHFIGYLEHGANYSFTHDEGVSVVCINARHFSKILSSQKDNLNLHLMKGKDNPSMRIGEFLIEGEDVSGFPDMQFHKKESTVSRCTITNISAKINFVGKALPTNKYRSSLCGIYFDLKNRQLVGADGNRLHTVSMSDADGRVNQNKDDIGVILPSSLLRVSKLIASNITVVDNGENQYARFGLKVPGCVNCMGVYRTLEGQYPNYMDVIPKEGFISKFIVKTKDFMLALYKAQIAIGIRDDKTMTCEFRNGLLIVSIKHMDRLIYQGVVKGEHQGASYCSCINVDYLVDAAQTIPGDSAEILLHSEKDKAWTIRNNSGYTAVIMPIDLEAQKH